MSGNGWCTHPDRQVSSDVRILVRKAELACRNAWGSDLWVDANADESAVTEGRQRPSEPPADLPIPSMPVSYDDTVTSVTSAGLTPAPRDDEVVEQSIRRFDDDDDEQDERRELLYRDSRSAIERARQRHMQRRQPSGERGEDTLISHDVEPVAPAAKLREPVFEPDDFIEEEAPKPVSVSDENDDALISEGVRTPTPRSLRLRRFRDERQPPKKDLTATENEPEIDRVDMELPPSAAPERGRFDSVPEISAEIELPLLRRSSSAEHREAAPAAPDAETYERALKRAHDIHAAARRERNQEQRAHTPSVLRDSSQMDMMPNLPDTPDSPEPAAGHRIDTNMHSTSAVLHPRSRRDQPEEAPRRALLRAHPSEMQGALSSSVQGDTPAREGRQSWWRGSRRSVQPDVEERPSPEPASYPESREVAAIPQHIEMPSPMAFDLSADDGLDSLRNRLFASASPMEEPVTPPRRTPISVARRQPVPSPPVTAARRAPARAPEREAVRTPSVDVVAPPRQDEMEREFHELARPVSVVSPEVSARRPEDQRQRTRPRPMPQDRPVAAPDRLRPEPIQPEALLEDPRDAWVEPEPVRGFDVRRLLDKDSGLLDMTIRIAPEVPRACATCRNYRESEREGRGWCTNEWAFTHRQMVNESDLACDSTIGCWWLPSDSATWFEELEVPTESTPRIDRLLAHLDPERRMVGN
jgi:hypothetical protein